MPAPWPYPFWIAHRGGGWLAPENTLAAFRVGAAHGYRAFECDVKLSADGVLFLLHDDTLDRTTDAKGLAGDLTWDQLSRLDAGSWHSPAFAGEPIPRLEAVLRYAARNGFAIDIEIKPAGGADAVTGCAVAERVQACWRACSSPPPLLSSFSATALQAAARVEPQLHRALLVDSPAADAVEQALALGCAAIGVAQQHARARCFDSIHAAGMRVLAYTVNDAARVLELVELGVDGIFTDAVDRLPASCPDERLRATTGNRR